MTRPDYLKILDHLLCASRTLAANQGDLCDADLRIRNLVSQAACEVERVVGLSKTDLDGTNERSDFPQPVEASQLRRAEAPGKGRLAGAD